MHLFLIPVLLILCCFTSMGQGFEIDWVHTIAGNSSERVHKICDDKTNGNIYAIGYFRDSINVLTTNQSDETFISSIHSDGQLNWLKKLNTNGPNQGFGITYDPNGYIYTSGAFNNTIQSQINQINSYNLLDAYLAKLDTNGQSIWLQHVGGVGFEYGYAVEVDNDGNVYMAGSFEDTLLVNNLVIAGGGLKDAFIVKYDSDGIFQWVKTWGGPAFVEAVSIDINPNNEIVVGGIFRDVMIIDNDTIISNGNIDGFLMKIDPNSTTLWTKHFGGTMLDELKEVKIDDLGYSYAAGWFDKSISIDGQSTSGSKEEDGFLIKFAPNGQLDWIQSIAGTFDERAYTIDIDTAYNVYVSGTVDSLLVLGGDTLTNRHLNRPTNLFLIQYNDDGQYIRSCSLGYVYNDYVFDMSINDNGDISMCGIFQDTSIFMGDSLFAAAFFDVFFCKIKTDQQVPIIKLTDEKRIHPIVYPNPSHDILHIQFNERTSSFTTYTIYQLNGKRIESGQINRIDDQLGILSINHLAPGPYLIQLHTETNIQAIIFQKAN